MIFIGCTINILFLISFASLTPFDTKMLWSASTKLKKLYEKIV